MIKHVLRQQEGFLHIVIEGKIINKKTENNHKHHHQNRI